MNMNLGKFREMVRDRETWYAAVYGVAESDMTEQLNNNSPVILSYLLNFPRLFVVYPTLIPLVGGINNTFLTQDR